MRAYQAFLIWWVLSATVISGCSPVKEQAHVEITPTSKTAIVPEVESTETAILPTPTELPVLIDQADFSKTTGFCAFELEDSQFALFCDGEALTVSQTDKRRNMDIYLMREQPVNASGFILTADVTSESADKNKLDQNQYGFYFGTTEGSTYALRVEGQYFNFEEWTLADGVEVADAYNISYAPALKGSGNSNSLRLVCDIESCELFANEEEIAHAPFGIGLGITSLGFFTSSEWDQQFGNISLQNLHATIIPVNWPELQSFFLMDNLSNDHGTFSRRGLSGAFSDFEQDGFHFSPVAAYRYYGAKAGPSLRNISVTADVNMEFSPGVPGSQFGGVVCRSSLDGMYAAVIKIDGSYAIYRGIKDPFALLAKGSIADLEPGRSDQAIRLDCIEDTISMYINGTQVESFTDRREGIRYGRAGLFTKAGGTPDSDAIIFSNFSIDERK